MVVKLPAVAVNEALVLDAATVTEAGAASNGVLVLNETTAPPVGAGAFSATVQVVVAFGPRVAGVQDIELTEREALGLTLTLPAIPANARELPPGVAPNVLVTPIELVPTAVGERMTVTVATVPFWTTVEFMPARMHWVNPVESEIQVRLLPAAVAADPVVSDIVEINVLS